MGKGRGEVGAVLGLGTAATHPGFSLQNPLKFFEDFQKKGFFFVCFRVTFAPPPYFVFFKAFVVSLTLKWVVPMRGRDNT